MNILIITPFYKQDRNIASVRWTNISQRLAKKHQVIVVSQPLNDMDMTFSKAEEDGMIVARMNQKTAYEKLAIKHFHAATGDDWQTTDKTNAAETPAKESTIRKAKNTLLYASMHAKAKDYARQICRDVIPQGMKIDVVISSACPFIEMLFGYELKKRLGCKWISDFRDWPYKTEVENDGIRRMKRILQKKMPEADAITVVTKIGRTLAKKETGITEDKIFTITNGYSKQDKRISLKTDPNRLRLVHTGSLYGGQCKSDLLFQAIRILRDRGSAAKIVFLCAGGNNSSLLETAQRYNVSNVVEDMGFIPRNDALDLQNSSDCLVSIIHNNCGGGFNAKILEYMLCEKPVINIACGNPKYGEATQVVKELNLGFAAEEANGEKDAIALADYLEMQATRKKNGIPLLFEPDIEGIKKYDYDSITIDFEKMCQSLVSKKSISKSKKVVS